MSKVLTPLYVASFQTEPFHQGRRYHWIICRADNGDELVSWGHEGTRELAEAAAEREVQILSSDLPQAAPVARPRKPLPGRRYLIGGRVISKS